MDLSLSTFVCLFISFSICLSTSYLSACVSVNIHPPFHHFCVCVYVREYSRSLTIIIYLPLVNKEEVVQKARPVSSDVGSTNPNFSDLMDEFIQERLRAKGTAVNTRRTNTQILQVSVLGEAKKLTFASFFLIRRAVVAAAREVWRFPETCRSS